jgi:hypothetical protein
MKTGNLIQHGRLPGAIAISRSVPKFLVGMKRFERLATPAYMHKFEKARFCRHYVGRVLADQDPASVWRWLHDLAGEGVEPILCCWERAPFTASNWCHRTMVAAWFRDKLGEIVDEIEPPQLRLPGC